MQVKTVIGGVLLAVGLLSAGCASDPQEESTEIDSLDTREDALPACNGSAFFYDYYKDAALTQYTGSGWCDCGDSTMWLSGSMSRYKDVLFESECAAAPAPTN